MSIQSTSLRAALLAWLFCTATLLRAQDAETGPSRWESAIRKFEEEDSRHPPTPGGVVFVGSSSIRLWDLQASFPDLDATNRGFGGSQLSDAAHFADRLVIPHAPRRVVVYAGDNDIASGKTPEQVVEAYRTLVQSIHEKLPQTSIAYISIKPSVARWTLIEKIRQANRAIAGIAAEDERLEFIDIEPLMLGPDGMPRAELFREDGLHLNAEGYKLWSEKVQAILEAGTDTSCPK